MKAFKKVLAVAVTIGIITSMTVSASALKNISNIDKSKELGSDQEFLNNKERQEEWIEQAWDRIDNKPVVGDWKTGARATGAWSWRDGVICYTDSYSSIGFNHGHAGIVGISPYNEGDHLAAAWAVQQVGKPYGEFYKTDLSDRNKFYCSQLVYAAYKDVCGVNLDTLSWPGLIHPMELVDNDKVTKIFDTN